MQRNVNVLGVGMTKFSKPGQSPHYTELAQKAVRAALHDADIIYDKVEQAYAAYCYGDTTSGQLALYPLGLTGIPIINVNNACSTGSTALFLARQAVETGAAECVLAVGFEEMAPGALDAVFNDRPFPLAPHLDTVKDVPGADVAPMAPKLFGSAIREYRDKYGLSKEALAMISVKARRHAANNPMAVFTAPLTVDEVLESKPVFDPLTRYMCCPPTCGAAAAILCSDDFAARHRLTPSVRISGQAMTTDIEGTFDTGNLIRMIGFDMAADAARQALKFADVDVGDVDVVELHDCFTSNELMTYEALGLTPVGTAERFIRDGDNTYGGKYVVNPSGGLLSKGHPLGATGLAQCAELTWQLRGQAGARQVENARVGLQHNLGLGGACVVTVYQTV